MVLIWRNVARILSGGPRKARAALPVYIASRVGTKTAYHASHVLGFDLNNESIVSIYLAA